VSVVVILISGAAKMEKDKNQHSLTKPVEIARNGQNLHYKEDLSIVF
jgi:hypothetical protein